MVANVRPSAEETDNETIAAMNGSSEVDAFWTDSANENLEWAWPMRNRHIKPPDPLTTSQITERLHGLSLKAEGADSDGRYFAHQDQRIFYVLTAILLDRIEKANKPMTEDENLIDRAHRLADELDKLGDYLIALKADDPRGNLQKEAAATMRGLADHIALTVDDKPVPS